MKYLTSMIQLHTSDNIEEEIPFHRTLAEKEPLVQYMLEYPLLTLVLNAAMMTSCKQATYISKEKKKSVIDIYYVISLLDQHDWL